MDSVQKPASEQIDNIISKTDDWRGILLARLRAVIVQADPGMVEAVKWKKPSKPEGIPVWTYSGKNVCVADTLKHAVRLTFPNGAQLKDPKGIFNARLDSKTVRAIDFYENAAIDAAGLRLFVIESLRLI